MPEYGQLFVHISSFGPVNRRLSIPNQSFRTTALISSLVILMQVKNIVIVMLGLQFCMTMNDIPAITYPVILMVVFARQLCLPLPATLLLMTAGALAKRGSLDVSGIILTGVVGCLFADYVWYAAGQRWGYRIVRILCVFSTDGPQYAAKARKLFGRLGLPVLMVAKFVPGLDGLMPPLAGMLNASVIWFLLFDAVGSLLWSAGYCFVGFLFARSLDIVVADLGRLTGTLALVLAGVFCYFVWRAWELLRAMKQLRLHTITPALLYQKLQAGKKIAVLDLLDVEGLENAQTIPGIPGAARISPKRLRSSAKVRVPSDVQIVLYCLAPDQLISARTAVALHRKGISNVWVLQGGLKAWRNLGFTVSTKLSSTAELAARFGVKLPEETNHVRSPLSRFGWCPSPDRAPQK